VRVLEDHGRNGKTETHDDARSRDNCLRGIDARVGQMADDWLSFHDELANAENMASIGRSFARRGEPTAQSRHLKSACRKRR
jgi:hypothetical protein